MADEQRGVPKGDPPPPYQPPPPPHPHGEQPYGQPPHPQQAYGHTPWGSQQPPGGWGAPPPGGYQPQGPENTPAVVALALGITGLVVFLFGAWFFFPLLISLPCSVAAIFVGRNGVKKVDSGETDRNRGLAQAGFITGIVGTVLSGLALAGWIIIGILIGSAVGSLEDIDTSTSLLRILAGG